MMSVIVNQRAFRNNFGENIKGKRSEKIKEIK